MKNGFREYLPISIRKLGFSMVLKIISTDINRFCALAIILILLSISQSTLSAQELDTHEIYDLRVGVERHYVSNCTGFTGICLLSGSGLPVTEKVIEHVEVNGTVYAVVTLSEWVWERDSNEAIIHAIDTTLYRMEEALLYEHVGGIDIPVFDFGFSKGDSIMNIIGPYVDEDDLPRYLVGQDGVASVILIDTLLQFSDGISRNVLWGDDTLRIGENIYPPPTVLEFDFSHPVWDKLPIPQYNFHQPFYYISGIGVILTPYNHRKVMMCGFKTPDGNHFGCYAPRHVSIDDPVDVPVEIKLLQNYPNPFNPSTTLRYTLPTSGSYRILLYNSQGSLITILDVGDQPPGEYQYRLEMGTYASGVYFVVLEQGYSRTTLPITLIK